VPACFDDPNNFNYASFCQLVQHIDLSQFDLVLVSDIEQDRYSTILTWIARSKIRNYKIALGSKHYNEEGINNCTTVVRYWWMYNLMRRNYVDEHMQFEKPYVFDALLGTRRPHRDFLMLNMQKHRPLLDRCVVTYRQGFPGEVINEQTTNIHNYFPGYKLEWPYISPNLDHKWEIKDAIGKITGPIQSISPYVPWEIYKNTWYTVVCETGFTGDAFFLTEKTSKVLFAKRIFVLFGTQWFLTNLRKLGFKTFGSIIDESYDEEPIDIVRYQKAWAQMLSLTHQDPVEVYHKVEVILEHNRQRMFELERETSTRMQELLQQSIPLKYQLNSEC
jgi:hypothetical protein